MAIEIVNFAMKHGDFTKLCKRLPDARTDEIWMKQWDFSRKHAMAVIFFLG